MLSTLELQVSFSPPFSPRHPYCSKHRDPETRPQSWRLYSSLPHSPIHPLLSLLFKLGTQSRREEKAEAAVQSVQGASQLLRRHSQTIPTVASIPPLSHSSSGVSYFLAQRPPGPRYSESRGAVGGPADTSGARNPWRLKQAERGRLRSPSPSLFGSARPDFSRPENNPGREASGPAYLRARALFFDESTPWAGLSSSRRGGPRGCALPK